MSWQPLLSFRTLPSQNKAIAYTLISIFFFSFMGIFIRKSSENIHIMEVIFFRNLLACLIIIPVMSSSGLASFKMNRPGLFVWRAIFVSIGMFSGFSAITLIPLAQATAISFTTPIFVTILAVFLLGEVIKFRRVAAIFVGFIGMLIIVQPGVGSISLGIILAFIGAFFHSINLLIVKKLTANESANAIVVWMVIMLVPISFVPAIFVWEWPSALTWLYLWCLAFCGTVGHSFFTRAYSLADITSLQPFQFIKLPMIAFLAWVIFSELPLYWTWLGGLIIFSSTVYITRREAKINKSKIVDSELLVPK
ncbi:DMT family transporter [Rhodobacteraceae bacterium nBUS_22]|jgi:drug/metabolite transporter (DMT)-like permease